MKIMKICYLKNTPFYIFKNNFFIFKYIFLFCFLKNSFQIYANISQLQDILSNNSVKLKKKPNDPYWHGQWRYKWIHEIRRCHRKIIFKLKAYFLNVISVRTTSKHTRGSLTEHSSIGHVARPTLCSDFPHGAHGTFNSSSE